MFVLGHIGIGRRLVGSRGRRLPAVPLLLGMLLPDVIDKTLYYAHISSFISCTRTVAHTGIFLLTVLAIGCLRRSRSATALGLGIATHVMLDCVLDFLNAGLGRGIGSGLIALTWPLYGWHFVIYDTTPWNHLMGVLTWPVMMFEAVGAILLSWEWWRHRESMNGQVRAAG